MSQHFLLSAAARSLSLATVARMSDEEARKTFAAIRWANNGGKPHCPKCGVVNVYALASRPLWKCPACKHQFSLTSGTIFASRKLAVRDYLLAIAIFVNGAKGYSALQLSRDLNCQYKTAFVLAHKLREAIGAGADERTVGGNVEIDGAYFGGYVKPHNEKAKRADLRKAENQTGKRQVVVVMRERGGIAVTGVFKAEHESVPMIAARTEHGSTVHADEAASWDQLHARFAMARINHSVAFSDNGACTNQAESFFSRLRRAEIGMHHHIAGPYLRAYATEMAWRENFRRTSNGEQYRMTALAAITHPVSKQWKGYWQRNWK